MNIREAAEQIKRTVPMTDVLAMYGMEVKRDGFMQCPFHAGDHTASLKVYKGGRGWSCFGCHAGGSVIDFVMKMDALPFAEAVTKINDELNLDLLRAVGFNQFFKKKADEAKRRDEFGRYMNQLKADNAEDEWIMLQLFDLWIWADSKPVADRTPAEWDYWLQLRDQLTDMEMTFAKNKRKEEVSFYEWQNERYPVHSPGRHL